VTVPASTATYRLDLPWSRPPLRSNDRRHWRQQATEVATVRAAVYLLAKQAKIPQGSHLTVTLHYAPGHSIKIDSHNLHPTVKAAVDAIASPPRKINPRKRMSKPWVGLQLVPDDDDRYVTVAVPEIHRPPEPGPRCWLTVEVTR
jgi:crossover junction endodeoxyribonuclease RusA